MSTKRRVGVNALAFTLLDEWLRMYRLHFFGGASIEGPRGPVDGPSVQARRLGFLARLAVARDQLVARVKLMALLWPDSAPERARHSVRDTIYVLNHDLEAPLVEVVGSSLRIDPKRCSSDVADFETAIESGDLERAASLYRGGFLDGLFLRDALEFEEWAREQRDRFSRAYAQALQELMEGAIEHRDYSQAVSWGRSLVDHDPYSGAATVQLMELLAATGNRPEALRQADAHVVRMREEFNTAPDEAVTDLANRLRDRSSSRDRVATMTPASGGGSGFARSIRHRWLSAIVVVATLGLVVTYIAQKSEGPGPRPAVGEATASPAVAILPFSVRGSEVAVLHEGMVDLLATALDGAAGLRTISPSTLLARWRETAPGPEVPDLPVSLDIARQTGARYALVGSAVAIGQGVRLVAMVYSVETNEQLGRIQVEGSLGDVWSLVDRLAVDVLRIILQRGEEELPEIDLASLTTRSPVALQAFLEGEVHLRHFELAAAGGAYARAVAADSNFVLAHYRLSYVYGWLPEAGTSTWRFHHMQKAVRLADRLPRRQALFVRTLGARHLWSGPPTAIELARQAVEAYPDDPQAWYGLGEVYLHDPGVLVTAQEIDRVFERAVERDPRNAESLFHYLSQAWWLADSSAADRRLEMFEAIAPGDVTTRVGQLALDLAFGDSSAQEKVIALLPAMDAEAIGEMARLVNHPRYTARQALIRELYTRTDQEQIWSPRARFFFNTAHWYGQLQEALPFLENPGYSVSLRAATAYWALAAGLPVPKEMRVELFDPAAIDSTASGARVFYAGAFAADRGRWSDHERAVAELRRRADRSFAQADTVGGIMPPEGLLLAGRVGALEGYALWRQGHPAEALARLEATPTRRIGIVHLWLGELYHETGRLREAERVFLSYAPISRLSIEPLSQRQLGKIYEQLEEYDKARESYEYFVEYWKNADPELQPIVEEARQAIIRLEGLRRE